MERESETVAQSGRARAVTIATNMAGRGTDILLGGNAEFMARLKLREMLMPRVVSQVEDDNPLRRSGKVRSKLRSAGSLRAVRIDPCSSCSLPHTIAGPNSGQRRYLFLSRNNVLVWCLYV